MFQAAILQQTSDYISQLESDKLKLHQQIDKLKRALTECKCNPSNHVTLADIFEKVGSEPGPNAIIFIVTVAYRMLFVWSLKDEGIGSPAEEDYEDMKRGISEVKHQLDRERRMRKVLEHHVSSIIFFLVILLGTLVVCPFVLHCSFSLSSKIQKLCQCWVIFCIAVPEMLKRYHDHKNEVVSVYYFLVL